MDAFQQQCLAHLLRIRLTGTPAEPLLNNPEASAVLLLNGGLAGILMEHPAEWIRIVEDSVKEGAHESAPGSVDDFLPGARPSPTFKHELDAQLQDIAAELSKVATEQASSAARGVSPEPLVEHQAAPLPSAQSGSRLIISPPRHAGPMSGFRASMVPMASMAPVEAPNKAPRISLMSAPGPQIRSHPQQTSGLLAMYAAKPPTIGSLAATNQYAPLRFPGSGPLTQGIPAPSVVQQYAEQTMTRFHQAPAVHLETESEIIAETPEDAQARRDTISTVIVRAFKLCVRHFEPNMVPSWTPMIAASLKNPRHHFGDSPEASHIQLIVSEMKALEKHVLAHLLQSQGVWPEPTSEAWFQIERGHFEHWTRKLVRPILVAAVGKWQRHMEVLCKEPRGSRKFFTLQMLDEELEKITSLDLKWLATKKTKNSSNQKNNNKPT